MKPKIRYIKEQTPPYRLGISATEAGLEVFLDSIILPGGPGSWVRDALWDEYIMTIVNRGETPVTVDRVRIIDPRGIYIDPGNTVIQVEEMSRDLVDAYAVAGISFALASSAAYVAWGLGAAGVVGGIALAPLAVVAAPAYFLWKGSKQRKDRRRIDAEFSRRLMGARNPYGLGGSSMYTSLPGISAIVTLGPGGAISGSNFFPMIPNPETLVVEFRRGEESHVLQLPIRENVPGIHVPAPQETVVAGPVE
jgi:hypothetical protein